MYVVVLAVLAEAAILGRGGEQLGSGDGGHGGGPVGQVGAGFGVSGGHGSI